MKADVEAALQGLVQSRQSRPRGDAMESLDFTAPSVPDAPSALRNG